MGYRYAGERSPDGYPIFSATSVPPPSDTPETSLHTRFRLSTFSGHGHWPQQTDNDNWTGGRSGMGVLHPSGMFLFEITIILFTNKFFIIYRLLGCFSNTTTTSNLENVHTRSFSTAVAPCQHLQAPPSPPPSKTSMVARFWGRLLFANISTPSALKTNHVCSFMRAVAPCQHQHPLHPSKTSCICSFLRAVAQHQPFILKSTPPPPSKTSALIFESGCPHHHCHPRRLAHTLVSEGGSSLLPPPPPFKMSAYAHFRGWLLSCHHPTLLPQLYF